MSEETLRDTFAAAEAENYKRHTISHCQIVPLYRDPPPPTLTDAERAFLRRLLGASEERKTVLGLLKRLGGKR